MRTGLAERIAGTRVLVLTARDWEHPQGGGSGENLRQQATRWRDWGADVRIVSGGFPGGAARVVRDAISIERMGTDQTVFAHVVARGLADRLPAADVVMEIVSGVFFLSPLWRRRTPGIVWLHHVRRDQYVAQYGSPGRPAGWLIETMPLRTLYRRARVLVPSQPVADALIATGLDPARVSANRNGLDTAGFEPGEKAEAPTLLALGRLRRYKRVHLLLDLVESLPGVALDVAGDGDERAALEREVVRRGLAERVRFHGFVDDAARLRLLQRAWVHVTASVAEGWGMVVTEAGACETPTVALAVGGLSEAVVDGETGILATDLHGLVAGVRSLLEDPALRNRMGRAARGYAARFSWELTARNTAEALLAEMGGRP